LAQQRVGALLVSPDTFFDNRRVKLVTLAARHVVPVNYPFREYVDAGGLMSYDASLIDITRLAGILYRSRP